MSRATALVILGTGGNSVDVLDTVNEINAGSAANRYECVAFLDDDERLWGTHLHGVPVRGPLATVSAYPEARFVLAVGSPSSFWKRARIADGLGLADERFETIVHPSASVSRMASLGPGTVILQNATVASNARLGRHVLILPNSVISHDVRIGDYTCLAGGVCVSGAVTIGRSCYLGTNCSIISRVTVGDGALIGMGSVILDNVPANRVYVGNPGRDLRPAREAPPA